MLPRPACTGPAGGRPEKHQRRAITDELRYVADNGALPTDFPPWRTVHGFFTYRPRAGVVREDPRPVAGALRSIQAPDPPKADHHLDRFKDRH
ncbi:transposase [Amycolatopsis jejuensis]|uniref:transposase n=1 Tax=Amycolatopsis jejuensis TaxID=330084 RepID=UPI000A00A873